MDGSFGQFLGSPFFGHMNTIFRYKSLFIFCILIRVTGNLMYAVSDEAPGNKPWFMFEARLVIGFGAGMIALGNAFLSASTTLEERTKVMSWSAQAAVRLLGCFRSVLARTDVACLHFCSA